MESVIKRQKLMRQMGECIKGTSGHQPTLGRLTRLPLLHSKSPSFSILLRVLLFQPPETRLSARTSLNEGFEMKSKTAFCFFNLLLKIYSQKYLL